MKKPVKVLLIVLVSAIGLTFILNLSFNVFSRQIGNFYVSRNDYNEAISWYEREYDFYHSDGSLVNLCNALLQVDDQSSLKMKYFALLLEKKPNQVTEMVLGNYYVEYLFALYQSDQITEFEREFEDKYKLLKNSSDYLGILSPFTLIYPDTEATTGVLTWSIGMIEKIIVEYDYDDIKRFGYKFESLIYKRLGDEDKATEFEEKSNLYQ